MTEVEERRTNMLHCYIKGKNLLQNGTHEHYPIAEGAVFIENKNETLDSGTIIIPQLDHKIDIEPYDVMVITNDNLGITGAVYINTKRMCVDSYTCTQVCLNPAIYKYEIKLFSETKLLEGIVLPSLKITRLVGHERKVYDYIEEYVRQYERKTDSSPTQGAYGSTIDLTDSSLNRFRNIQCPEMQWNNPTLREVLNDLMMVDDCIPVLSNGVLKAMDLSETGSEITDTQKAGINYITETQSSDDYVSEIKMHMVNAMNSSVASSNVYENMPDDSTKVIEEIGLRNSENYILNTDSVRLETSYPIWKLLFVKCILNFSATCKYGHYGEDWAGEETFTNVDFSFNLLDYSANKYIFEYGEWSTKPIYYGGFTGLIPRQMNNRYQNTTLYYKRGSKNILNFNAKYEWQPLFVERQNSVLEIMLWAANFMDSVRNKCKELHPEYEVFSANIPVVSDDPLNYDPTIRGANWKGLRFKVAYQSLDDAVFRVSKSPMPTNQRVIVDNQTNSYVDAYKQGMLEYLKAKRLGNKVSLVNARYSLDETAIPALAQKINDKIIFRKEISVYTKHINVNYYAIENYVLKDYFTGIKSKIRSWKILDGDEALTRAELIKLYINSNIPVVNNENYVINTRLTAEQIMQRCKYCVIRFITGYDSNNNPIWTPSSAEYLNTSYDVNGIMVEFTKHKVGNSFIFTVKMPDNAFAGRYLTSMLDADGGPKQKPIQYTNDDGEIYGGEILFYSEYMPNKYPYNPQQGDTSIHIENTSIKPLVKCGLTTDDDTEPVNFYGPVIQFKVPFKIHKDNGEIFQLTIQLEYNDEANDIFLGKK